jgi:hypothetical protein
MAPLGVEGEPASKTYYCTIAVKQEGLPFSSPRRLNSMKSSVYSALRSDEQHAG